MGPAAGAAGRPRVRPRGGAVRHPARLPEALLEGFAWDVEGRRYADLPALRAYAVRVAGTVGAMMAVLMGVRDPRTPCRGGRSWRGDAIVQHRPRRGRGCPQRPALSAAGLAGRGRHRSGACSWPRRRTPRHWPGGGPIAGSRGSALPSGQRRHRAFADGLPSWVLARPACCMRKSGGRWAGAAWIRCPAGPWCPAAARLGCWRLGLPA